MEEVGHVDEDVGDMREGIGKEVETRREQNRAELIAIYTSLLLASAHIC